MGFNVLIVDDDIELLELLKDALYQKGYEVVGFHDAYPAITYIKNNGLPHLALIDYRMPGMDGVELSHKLKTFGDIPIIVISNIGAAETIADSLDSFADDYVTKPFDLRVLLARVQRLLSRIYLFEYVTLPIIEVDNDLAVDFGKNRLVVAGQEIAITPIEARLLHVLMRNAGKIVTYQTLISRVWPSEEIYEETLRVHMHRLRRKIEHDIRQPQYIKTERGIGYRFTELASATISQLRSSPQP